VFDFCDTHWFWVIQKIQNQGIASLGYFKNFKEPLGLMKEPAKTGWF
jgi:hypothetical protein